MWDMIRTSFREYAGTGMMTGLFLAAEIFLFVKEKNKTIRILLLYMPVLLLLLYFFPPFASFIYTFVGDEIYYRLLWLVPVTPVLAYTAVRIWESCGGTKKWLAGAVMAVTVMLSGSLVYTSPHFSRAENLYHVPQPVVDICDAISEPGVKAAFPLELVQYVRQYDPAVNMPYGREMLVERWVTEWQLQNELCALLNVEVLDAAAIAENAREQRCLYVIFREGKTVRGSFEENDFELYQVVDGYMIYRNERFYEDWYG